MANKLNAYEITSFRGGISDWEDKGPSGSFKNGWSLDIRKRVDSLSCNQALMDIGVILQSVSASRSPSSSYSPSASVSSSISNSISPSSSPSPSRASVSSSYSPSASGSPSSSFSPSASTSPSHSTSPSPSSASGLRLFKDLILFFVKCTDGATYGFGDQGKVYKINEDFSVFLVYDLHKKITGAMEEPDENGNTYLYFADSTSLHRKQIPGRADWNDVDEAGSNYPKTNLNNTAWHTMVQASGALHIANRNCLAMIGYDGSYTNETVDLIPGNVAKTLVERNGRVIIGTHKTADVDNGVNAALDTEVPLAQIGDDGEVYFANMVDQLPAKRFPGGGKCYPGGVTAEITGINFFEWEQDALSWISKKEVRSLALFGVFSADAGYNGIYSYGRRIKNHPFVMNCEYALEVDEIGALENVNGILYVSYRDGADYGVKVKDMTTKATAIYEGTDYKSPLKLPEKPTYWPYVELEMAPLPSGASVEFWYRMNKNGSFVRARTTDNKESYAIPNGKIASFSVGAPGNIYEARVVLNPINNSSPEVFKIRSYFM